MMLMDYVLQLQFGDAVSGTNSSTGGIWHQFVHCRWLIENN